MTRNQRILYEHCSRLAYRDYRQANPKPVRRKKPYSLSADTIEAKNMYALSMKGELTREELFMLMEYLMRVKLTTNILDYVK